MLPNLKLLRQEYGISQQKLADATGGSQQSINQYENHNIEPDIATLCAFAEYFNTSIDYIVGRTDVRRKIENTTEHYLNKTEAALIQKYRKMNPEQKNCIDTMADTLSK